MRGTLDVAGMRRFLDDSASPLPRGVTCESATFGGIAGERIVALDAVESAPRLFYVHGGGFVSGSPQTHRSITGGFARRGFDVFAVDYRLAPEHPFPAGLDDVAAAWRAYSAEGPSAIAGDSAGANLALALMLRCREEGMALPHAAILMSPPVDLSGSGDSMRTNAARDPMFEVEALRQLVSLYLGDADPTVPESSPLFTDLGGLPPLCIQVGATEVLRDDSRRLAEKARAAGVTVLLREIAHVPHVWQWAERFLPEARRSLDEAAVFLHRYSVGEG